MIELTPEQEKQNRLALFRRVKWAFNLNGINWIYKSFGIIATIKNGEVVDLNYEEGQ